MLIKSNISWGLGNQLAAWAAWGMLYAALLSRECVSCSKDKVECASVCLCGVSRVSRVQSVCSFVRVFSSLAVSKITPWNK